MSEWPPIDSAPKDGTQILVARINDDVGCDPIEITEWCVSDYPTYEHVEGDLYRKISHLSGYWNGNGHRATHWMPLPEPPRS